VPNYTISWKQISSLVPATTTMPPPGC